MKNFDVLDIRLEGSNLIEASAGTGKTYSLAILALRLVCERKMLLKEILMVTFTNAATAELEVRIRRFIREAYRYMVHNQNTDKTIRDAVDNAVLNTSRETVTLNLWNAVRNLDETSVMTIHSFCQGTLGEFQFETDNVDKTEVIQDLSDLAGHEVNEFWRREISVLDPLILCYLCKHISKSKILVVIHKVLNNKHFNGRTVSDVIEREAVKLLDEAWVNAKKSYENHVLNDFESIAKRAASKKTAFNFINKCQNDPKKFIEEFRKVRENDYSKEVFQEEREMLDEIDEALGGITLLMNEYCNILLKRAVEKIIPDIHEKMKVMNLVSFNDLISSVHVAMRKGKLTIPLNLKYKAVFIDEFQDTDKLQYEIFAGIFQGKAIMFYIGDPKQSIYAWRSADLPTYLQARKDIGVDNCFSMDSNFRSTPQMIAAMNKFFRADDGFDVFSSNEIVYRRTIYPEDLPANFHGELTHGIKPVVPITVINKCNLDQIADFTGTEILRLLTDKDFIIKDKNDESRHVSPSDITVLVRSGNQGKVIKSRLSVLGIPAITLDDQKVLESDEVKQVMKIMRAVIRPNRKSINSFLADEFMGYDLQKLQHLDDEKLLGVFTELKESWMNSGIYDMLFSFLNEFSMIEKCLSQEGTGGQRSLTNIFQIMEILHDAEVRKQLKPDELYAWIEKSSHDRCSDDEYQQRIESDENAVQIMTIHKCKGLTFNIVFNPYLDFHKHSTDGGITFRDNDGSYIFTYDADGDALRLYEKQLLQENKRLIYVAMTRAVYKTYINSNSYYAGSELKEFLNFFQTHEQKQSVMEWIEFDPLVQYENIPYTMEHPLMRSDARPAPGKAFEKTWGMHSFSSLSHKHESFTSEDTEFNSDYDRFVFGEMPRGEKAGLFLHSIFEHLDFSNPDGYEAAIESAGEYYSSVYRPEHKPLYLELVNHCMNAGIKNREGDTLLRLREISSAQKLPELEFYFSLDNHQKSRIAEILPDVEFTTDPVIEGMMHGFIDLLLEHNGKYYIIDWKSNFLGNRIKDYDENGRLEGMRANNYHLQYHIYTIAVRRYLEKKLKGFDYENHFGGVIYMFLRGVREDDSSRGIFFDKPPLEKITALESLFYK